MAPTAACGELPPSAGGKQLPIRVLSRCLVKASHHPCDPHVAAFSNLDLYPDNVQASLVCLYPKLPEADSSKSFDAVVSTFHDVLPSLLNHLYPLAGRIIVNPASGLPELHCHNQGAELVVGEVGVALGSLDYDLAEESLKKMVLPYDEDLPLSVQLLSFTCGGFSVVWGNNNLASDGNAITKCVRMWSELARTGRTTEGAVNHDRSVFRPRDPPAYGAAMDAMFATYDERRMVNALTAQASFVERLYYDTYLQELVDWVEEHKTEHVMEKGVLGMGTPTVNQTVFASFPLDTDFGFGDATLALPMCDYGRLCSGYLSVGARPGGDGSWLVSAYIWPKLATALDSDGIFKPLTAEYLALV